MAAAGDQNAVKDPRRRVLHVLAAVEAAREAHPELRLPLNWNRLQRVVARERITMLRLPIEANAYVVGRAPVFTMVLNSDRPSRYHTRYAAHEYGHIRLGHVSEAGEIEKQLAPCQPNDPREWEAELFAVLLRLGPDATIEAPEAAAIAGRITAAELLRRRPPQLNLEMPEPAPVFRPRPVDHKLLNAAYEDALNEHRRTRRTSRVKIFRDPLQTGEDFSRIQYDEAKRATVFTDVADRRWWVYNFAAVIVAGRRHWLRVYDFMSPDITHRLFVNSLRERRIYTFDDRHEARAYRVKHLDRQLAHALVLKNSKRSLITLASRLRSGKKNNNA
jgi:hypothetical protein